MRERKKNWRDNRGPEIKEERERKTKELKRGADI